MFSIWPNQWVAPKPKWAKGSEPVPKIPVVKLDKKYPHPSVPLNALNDEPVLPPKFDLAVMCPAEEMCLGDKPTSTMVKFLSEIDEMLKGMGMLNECVDSYDIDEEWAL